MKASSVFSSVKSPHSTTFLLTRLVSSKCLTSFSAAAPGKISGKISGLKPVAIIVTAIFNLKTIVQTYVLKIMALETYDIVHII